MFLASLLLVLAQLILLTCILAVVGKQWHICARRRRRSIPAVSETQESGIDDDVREERQRLCSPRDDLVISEGLGKVFYVKPRSEPSAQKKNKLSLTCPRLQPMVVVDDLWFGIRPGECFGLLGPNGAGKTTSIAMLTGESRPTTGQTVLAGFDMTTHAREAFQHLGFCPQFDALYDDLSIRENLTLFAQIKGVASDHLDAHIDALIQAIGLQDHAEKVARNLSGGTRRKLSFGIAVIASPAIMVLDEPSTGMDPASRRFMWRIIRSNVTGRACLLTTHSMEEADALCSRIGIMVKGRLCALGTSQHLKRKFGDGYRLEIQVKRFESGGA